MRHHAIALDLAFTMVALWGAGQAFAATESGRDALKACLDRESEAEVFTCAQAILASRTAAVAPNTGVAAPTKDSDPAAKPAVAAGHKPQDDDLVGNFERKWALLPTVDDNGCHQGLCAYRPNYVIIRHSDAPNAWPSSSAPGHSVSAPVSSLPMEAKFQISFKTLAYAWADNRWQLWAAYTQQNQWQVFNSLASRPFRESDYEPELMLHRRWESGMPGYDQGLRFVGVSLNHQSNGQSNPLSRSWNRLILQAGFAGFAGGNWTAIGKVWHRVREDAESDDNPRIENYIGRGELTVNFAPQDLLDGKSVLSLRMRHSLSRHQGHGSGQLEWAIPIKDAKYRVFLQAFRGYGESMIDFNHLQTTFGIGFGFMDW